MSDPQYDGLCGIPLPHSYGGGLYLRCTYEPDHTGEHSWKRYQHHFRVTAGVFRSDMIRWFHPVPKGCTCTPCRGDQGEIVEYIFNPDCPSHTTTVVPAKVDIEAALFQRTYIEWPIGRPHADRIIGCAKQQVVKLWGCHANILVIPPAIERVELEPGKVLEKLPPWTFMASLTAPPLAGGAGDLSYLDVIWFAETPDFVLPLISRETWRRLAKDGGP